MALAAVLTWCDRLGPSNLQAPINYCSALFEHANPERVEKITQSAYLVVVIFFPCGLGLIKLNTCMNTGALWQVIKTRWDFIGKALKWQIPGLVSWPALMCFMLSLLIFCRLIKDKNTRELTSLSVCVCGCLLLANMGEIGNVWSEVPVARVRHRIDCSLCYYD